MRTFGDNIRTFRKAKNLSQKQLGVLLGFSARTISDWECNNTEPAVKVIKQLVCVLDVSLEDLFYFEE